MFWPGERTSGDCDDDDESWSIWPKVGAWGIIVSVSSPSDPLDQLKDAFIYAPLALLLNAEEHLPKLAEQGRNQINAAKIIGEMAVKMGSSKLGTTLTDVASGLGLVVDEPVRPAKFRPEDAESEPANEPVTKSAAPKKSSAKKNPAAKKAAGATTAAKKSPAKKTAAKKATAKKPAAKKTSAAKKTAAKKPAASADVPVAASLALADFESLSASQVVPRLDRMAADELEAIRRFEAENRGRRTILNRIAQLQADA